MSKILKGVGTALALVAAVAGTVVTLGAAAPAAAGLFGLSLGGTIAAAGAAATALSTIGALTAKRPVNERQGSQLQFKIDPSGPIPYVMGRTAVAGTVVYRDTYGKDNHYQSLVVVLSGGGPIGGIDAFTADRVTVNFSGQAATGYYATWMWQDQQTGTTPESNALNGPVGATGPFGPVPAMPNWGSSYKLSGYAAACWTLLFDTKARRYSNGEPKPAWIVRGAKVYDPRLDSTYPGGSGSCRWASPADAAAHAAARATWVYSDTPALHGLMWRLGIWQRDESDSGAKYQKLGGIGAPVDMIDLAAIVHAANVQEANGWTIGGEVDFGQDKWEVLKLIDETGGAEPIANGALMSTLVKAPRVSLRTITAADLADGPISVPAVRPRSERINGYRAQFRSEAHGWEIVPIDIVQVPLYVTEDGRARTGSGTFSLCANADHCAELAAYEVFDSREIDGIQLPLKPLGVAYRIGDCLTLDIPELGLQSRDVVVRGRTIDPATGIVVMTFRTETAAKHDAALGLTGATPPTPTLTADPDSVEAPEAGSWTLAVIPPNGTILTTPALQITGAVDNSRVDAVVFEYRLFGATDWIAAGIEPTDQTEKTIAGVKPDESYEVAVRYRARGIFSDRLVLGPTFISADGTPALFSTRNDDGANMIRSPLTLDEATYTNGAAPATFEGAPAIQLFTTAALGRWGPKVPCRPGETLFHSYLLSADGPGSETVNASYTYFDANGTALGAVNLSSASAPSLNACNGITATITFSFQVPSTAFFIQIYIERPVATGQSFFARQPYLGRSAPGATVGAVLGVNVVDPVAGTVPTRDEMIPGQVLADRGIQNGATPGAILDANPAIGNFRLGDGSFLSPDLVLTELGESAGYFGQDLTEQKIFTANQNRVFNSQFKYRLAGWSGGAFVWYNDWLGTFVSAPLGTGGVQVLSAEQPINCGQSIPVTLSATFRGDASVNQFLFVDVAWHNGGNNALVGYSSTATNGVFWSNIATTGDRKSQTFNSPNATDGSGFVKAYIRIVTNSDVAVSVGELLVTKIQLETGSIATLYNEAADDGAILSQATGQIRDSRNLNISNSFGLPGLSLPCPLADTVIGGQLYLTIGAGSYSFDGGVTVNYPSATLGPGPFGLFYHVWANVPVPGQPPVSYDASPDVTHALGTGKHRLGGVQARANAGAPPETGNPGGAPIDNGNGYFIP